MPQSEAPDFFDQHLSKMLVAPSFEQGPPPLPAGAGWHPEQRDLGRAGDSEASTQSSDGRQGSTQVDRHMDRHHSVSSGGDNDVPAANPFASMNAAGNATPSLPPAPPQHHAVPAPPPAAPAAQFDAMASMPAPPPSRGQSGPSQAQDPMRSHCPQDPMS